MESTHHPLCPITTCLVLGHKHMQHEGIHGWLVIGHRGWWVLSISRWWWGHCVTSWGWWWTLAITWRWSGWTMGISWRWWRSWVAGMRTRQHSSPGLLGSWPATQGRRLTSRSSTCSRGWGCVATLLSLSTEHQASFADTEVDGDLDFDTLMYNIVSSHYQHPQHCDSISKR